MNYLLKIILTILFFLSSGLILHAQERRGSLPQDPSSIEAVIARRSFVVEKLKSFNKSESDSPLFAVRRNVIYLNEQLVECARAGLKAKLNGDVVAFEGIQKKFLELHEAARAAFAEAKFPDALIATFRNQGPQAPLDRPHVQTGDVPPAQASSPKELKKVATDEEMDAWIKSQNRK